MKNFLKLDTLSKWIRVVLSLIVIVAGTTMVARATIDGIGRNLQTPHMTSTSDLPADSGARQGHIATVGTGSATRLFVAAAPSSYPSIAEPNAFTAASVRWLTPGLLLPPVSSAIPGLLPPVGSAGTVPISDGSAVAWNKISVDWHSTLPTAADHVPMYIESGRGIDLEYSSGNNEIIIQTNFPVPICHITGGADISPNRIDIGRGLEILSDGTGGVIFETNFAVPDPITNLTSGINFSDTYSTPKLTQTERTGGNAYALDIIAQAVANTPSSSNVGGDLNLYAGRSGVTGDLDGQVNIGVEAYGSHVGATLLQQYSSESTAGMTTSDCRADLIKQSVTATSETHVISRAAGFAIEENVWWHHTSQASTTDIVWDIPIAIDGAWKFELDITAQGGTLGGRTRTYYASRTSGTLDLGAYQDTLLQLNPATPATLSKVNNSLVRFAVTPQNATLTNWTFKVSTRGS